eukprot:NODE_114_length_18474_cov_1.567510.p11 type:complete len:155 gc:universal NODE_114_length_18474_cov_1.567510:4448-3984(-)
MTFFRFVPSVSNAHSSMSLNSPSIFKCESFLRAKKTLFTPLTPRKSTIFNRFVSKSLKSLSLISAPSDFMILILSTGCSALSSLPITSSSSTNVFLIILTISLTLNPLSINTLLLRPNLNNQGDTLTKLASSSSKKASTKSLSSSMLVWSGSGS